jgi:hypothetical protein
MAPLSHGPVGPVTIDNWKIRYPQFLGSLKGKATNGRAVALQTRHWLER